MCANLVDANLFGCETSSYCSEKSAETRPVLFYTVHLSTLTHFELQLLSFSFSIRALRKETLSTLD